MKDKKETVKKETENKKAEKMQELDDEAMDQVSGAGNPFANAARVPTQKIDSTVRKNG